MHSYGFLFQMQLMYRLLEVQSPIMPGILVFDLLQGVLSLHTFSSIMAKGKKNFFVQIKQQKVAQSLKVRRERHMTYYGLTRQILA